MKPGGGARRRSPAARASPPPAAASAGLQHTRVISYFTTLTVNASLYFAKIY